MCELCQATGAKLYENEICWVREHLSDLLVAWKLHGSPDDEEGDDLAEMIEVGRIMGNGVFGEGKWVYDYNSDIHFNFHVRRKL